MPLTSERYGKVVEKPQSETTPSYPRMYTCNGILFNHESPRRGRTFVIRKISGAVARSSLKQACLYLRNLDAKRDWGHAADYFEGMWRMLQQERPEDFVLATGKTHPVREFWEKSFAVVGITVKGHVIAFFILERYLLRLMADNPTPHPTPPHNKANIRSLLEGMSEHRIDPRRVKITETGPRAKGGQGTVVPGTIIPAGEVPTWLPEHFPKAFLERKLAIKKFEWNREDAEASAKFFKSFVNEIWIMAGISHPYIVEFIGFVEDMEKGDAWIIIPWESNGNVREFLQSGEWDIPERVSLVQDVIRGVEYLHTREPPICHGDLKSLNILVNSSYHAVITDFGSARSKGKVDTMKDENARELLHQPANGDITPESTSPKLTFSPSSLELTLTGPAFSLRWTAPEVLNNGVQDLPSDMWAIGWICWEIFTSKIPFNELTLQGAIISQVMKGELPAIREEAHLSHVLRLCGLMSACWISNPAKRIDALTFRQKISFMPSTTPSGKTSGGVKVRSATLLHELGTMYRDQNDTVMAESHYQSATDVASKTADDEAKAKALCGLGQIYCAQSRNQEAEKAFMEAHAIHSRIGHDLGAAEALCSLGENYRRQSRNQEAQKVLITACEIYSRVGSGSGTANVLHILGETYRDQSRNQEAEKVLVDAHEIHSRIGNDLGVGNTLCALGDTYCRQSRYQEAESAFSKAYETHSRMGQDLGAANALVGLGHANRLQSRNHEAEKVLMKAHEIQSRLGDELGVANALDGLGQIYYAQSKDQEAEKVFMKVHEIYSRIGNDHLAAYALVDLGETYRRQSKNQEAEKAFMKAHEMLSRIGNDLGAAHALHSMGETYHEQSRNQEAEKAFMKAHEIYSRIGHEPGAARVLVSLGQTYRRQSRIQEAEKVFAKAHEIHFRIDDDLNGANALLDLGHTYCAQGSNPEAENVYTKAHAIYSRMGDDLGAANALLSLGHTYSAQSRNQEAEKAFMKAHEIQSRIGNDLGAANALIGLGNTYRIQSKNHEAEKAFIEAHEIHSGIGDDHRAATALLGLGHAYFAQSRYQEAEKAFRKAHEIWSSTGYDRGARCALVSLGQIYRW